jgi:hypothetical protein
MQIIQADHFHFGFELLVATILFQKVSSDIKVLAIKILSLSVIFFGSIFFRAGYLD